MPSLAPICRLEPCYGQINMGTTIAQCSHKTWVIKCNAFSVRTTSAAENNPGWTKCTEKMSLVVVRVVKEWCIQRKFKEGWLATMRKIKKSVAVVLIQCDGQTQMKDHLTHKMFSVQLTQPGMDFCSTSLFYSKHTRK